MSGDENDFEKDLEIDKYSLDVEWLNFPMLYAKWARALVVAQEERQTIKDEMELYKASLDGKIRADPTSYGITGKLTESSITNTILKQKRYKMFVEELIDATTNVGILTAARASMEHKKKALENLTSLFLAGYWAEKIPPKVSDELDEQLASKMRKEMKNKKKRKARK